MCKYAYIDKSTYTEKDPQSPPQVFDIYTYIYVDRWIYVNTQIFIITHIQVCVYRYMCMSKEIRYICTNTSI